ncbi:MAG: hypothetical protein FJ144_06315 [Deltaproteobacteria bacterium]|nr:hypothetical protein [Deltaproteobacteria bacterium]
MTSSLGARPRPWLLAIVLLGLALRAWEFGWGLPDFIFFDSKFFFIWPAFRLVWQGVWTTNELIHTPLLAWVIGLFYWPWATLVSPPAPTVPEEAIVLDVIGRGLTLVLSTASIPLVYLIARRLLGTRTALLAAAAFAVMPLHVLETHRINADLWMIFVSLVCIHQAVIARDEDRTPRLMLAFALAGFAAATKLTGLAVGLVPAWVAFTRARWSLKERLGWLALGGGLALVVLLAVILPVLTGATGKGPTLGEGFTAAFVTGRRGEDLGGEGWTYTRYLYWLVVGFPFLMGWSIYLTSLAGFVLMARSERGAFGLLAAGAIPFFLFQAGAASVTTRYCMPLVPYFAIAAGFALDRAARSWRRIGPLLGVLVLGYATLFTASLCLRISPEPRQEVGRLLRGWAESRSEAEGPLVVGFGWLRWFSWDPIGLEIENHPKIRLVEFPSRKWSKATPEEAAAEYRDWLERERVDVVLLNGPIEGTIRREGSRAPEAPLLAELERGSLGFRGHETFRTPFLTESLYLWGDPALDAQLPDGIGTYSVFARRVPDLPEP